MNKNLELVFAKTERIPAYFRKEEVSKLHAEFVYSKRSLYYDVGIYASYDIKIGEDDWGGLDRIVVYDGDIIGRVHASIHRSHNICDQLSIVKYKNNRLSSLLFLYHVLLLIDELIDIGITKVVIDVIDGNPAKRLYDRYLRAVGNESILKYVGVQLKQVRLKDGNTYNKHLYDLMLVDELRDSNEELRRHIQDLIAKITG